LYSIYIYTGITPHTQRYLFQFHHPYSIQATGIHPRNCKNIK
jgi:hypothetical protein